MTDLRFSHTVFPEDESPEHYLRLGHPEEVARKCQEIRAAMLSGNVWAWCTVVVYVTCPECGAEHGEEEIGRAFKSEEDFLASDCYANLREEAAAGIEHKPGCSCRNSF